MCRIYCYLSIIVLCTVLCGVQSIGYADDNQLTTSMTPEQLSRELDQRYQAWSIWVEQHQNSSTVDSCDEFRHIVALGPQALPLIIEHFRKGEWSPLLSPVVEEITQVLIPSDRWPKGRLGDSYSAVGVHLQWWDVDRPKVKDTFQQLLSKWQELKAAKDTPMTDTGQPILWYDVSVLYPLSNRIATIQRKQITPLGEVYFSVEGLGIDVLPLIVERLEQGDTDFLPIFNELTKGGGEKNGPLQERLDYLLAWWKDHKDEWTIPDATVK